MPWWSVRYTQQVADEWADWFDAEARRLKRETPRDAPQPDSTGSPLLAEAAGYAPKRPSLARRILRRIRGGG